ncbi:MAG: hypothetical protein KAS32_20020 [Candidatus Peribacteraceae bacterium]|nr:hypothetical protein [Candidatus Peribacteraceae bacterium]
MPVMDEPKVPKEGLESEVTAKRVVRYLGLMSKERKSLAKTEKKLKGILKQYMRKKGLPKITATDGSTAVLDEQERRKWDYGRMANDIDLTDDEFQERYCEMIAGERLTCRVPK